MNKNDVEVFNVVSKDIRKGELYLGHVPFVWRYSIVSYKADCTIAVPFTIFEKAIGKILQIDGLSTKDKLGEILGLNITDNPEKLMFKDEAEDQILDNSLQEMHDCGMIDIRIYSGGSYYVLTDKGKEFMHIGKKLETHQAKHFDVYFDMTLKQNEGANKVFSNVGGNFIDHLVIPMFNSAEYLKSFLATQYPEVYDPEAGNSFDNLSIESASNYELPLNAAFLYNPENEFLRMELIAKGGKLTNLTDILEKNHNSYRGLVSKFFSNSTNAFKFESIHDAEYIDEEKFWTDICTYIAPENDILYFSIDELSQLQVDAIEQLKERNPFVHVFVSCRITEIMNSRFFYYEGVYIWKNIIDLKKPFCQCNHGPAFEYRLLEIPCMDRVCGKVVVAPIKDYSFDANALTERYTHIFVPPILDMMSSKLERSFALCKEDLEVLEYIDYDIKLFEPYITDGTQLRKLENIRKRRDRSLATLKQLHDLELHKKFWAIEKDVHIEKINRLFNLHVLKEKIEKLKNEMVGTSGYSLTNKDYMKMKESIDKREHFIREKLMARTFVIDTNIFLDEPRILSKIKGNDYIVLPLKVLDELDKFKIKEDEQKGENARIALKEINELSKKKDSKLKMERFSPRLLPEELSPRNPDNMFLSIGIAHKEDNPFIVTSDNGMQSKARALGIPVYSLADLLADTKNK